MVFRATRKLMLWYLEQQENSCFVFRATRKSMLKVIRATLQGCLINDQSPNIKIFKVLSDFPIKYGPKTLKNPQSISTLDPCRATSLFENTMGNPFFYFFKCQPKRLIFFLDQIYGHSHFKYAFKINFQLLEVVKLKICKYAYLRIFSLTTSQSRKLIQSFWSIFYRKIIRYFLNFDILTLVIYQPTKKLMPQFQGPFFFWKLGI